MADQAKLELVISGNPAGANQAIKSLGQNMKTLQTQTGSLNQTLKSIGSGITATLKGLGAVALGAAAAAGAGFAGMKSLADSAARTAQEVEKLARTTGMSAEKASLLRGGAQLLGVEFNTLEGAITGMLNNMKTLNTADNPFRLLGISVVDGSGRMKDMNSILDQTLERLKAMGPTGARTMFAERVFGGATPELLRMIDSGAEGLKKAGEAAKEMGLVLSGDQVQMAIQYRTAVRGLGQAWEGLKLSLGTAIMPMLTRLFTTLAQGARTIIPAVRDVIKPFVSVLGQLWNVGSLVFQVMSRIFRSFMDTTGAGRALSNVVKSIQQAFMWFGNVLKGVSEWLSRLKERLTNTDVATVLKEMWANVKKYFQEKEEELVKFLEDPESPKKVSAAVGKFLVSAFNVVGHIGEALTGMLKGITSGLAEFFSPSGTGSKIFSGLATFIDNYAKFISSPEQLQKLFEAGKQGGKNFIDGGMDAMLMGEDLLIGLVGLVVGIGKVLTSLFSNAASWAMAAKALMKGLAVGAAQEALDRGPEFWTEFNGNLAKAFSGWLAQAGQSVINLGKQIADKMAEGLRWAAEVWNDIVDSLGKWIAGIGEKLKAKGQEIAQAVASALKWAPEVWGDLLESLGKWISDQWSNLAALGSRIGQAIGDAVRSAVNSAIQGINTKLDKVPLLPDSWRIPEIPTSPAASAPAPSVAAVNGNIPAPSSVPAVGNTPPPSIAAVNGNTPAPDLGKGLPTSEAEATANEDKLKSPAFVKAEIDRAKQVIDNRKAEGLPTSDQEAYLARLRQMQAQNPQQGLGTIAMANGGVLMPKAGGHRMNLFGQPVKAAEAGVPEMVSFLPLEPALFRRLGLAGGSTVVENHIHVHLDGKEVGRMVQRQQMQNLKMQQQMAF